MIFQLNDCILDIDVERTRAFYERSDVQTASEACSCVNCHNFDKAILKASAPVLNFLHSLGIDPRKPAEAYNVTGQLEKSGTIWYNGWYHVCGTVVESPETVQVTVHNDGPNIKRYCWEHSYSPDPDYPFEILPISDNALLHKNFPTPVIQLEIDTHLPYVLSIPFEA